MNVERVFAKFKGFCCNVIIIMSDSSSANYPSVVDL